MVNQESGLKQSMTKGVVYINCVLIVLILGWIICMTCIWCIKENATYMRKLRSCKKNRMLIANFSYNDELTKRNNCIGHWVTVFTERKQLLRQN